MDINTLVEFIKANDDHGQLAVQNLMPVIPYVCLWVYA